MDFFLGIDIGTQSVRCGVINRTGGFLTLQEEKYQTVYPQPGITKNVPTIESILKLIDSELITEKIIYATDLRTNNPSLYEKVLAVFDDCDREEVPHIDLIQKYAPTLKCFVHTGEYSPWGNIILVAGTDPFKWFQNETTVVPEFYHKRLKQIRASKKLSLFDQEGFTRKDC